MLMFTLLLPHPRSSAQELRELKTVPAETGGGGRVLQALIRVRFRLEWPQRYGFPISAQQDPQK